MFYTVARLIYIGEVGLCQLLALVHTSSTFCICSQRKDSIWMDPSEATGIQKGVCVCVCMCVRACVRACLLYVQMFESTHV